MRLHLPCSLSRSAALTFLALAACGSQSEPAAHEAAALSSGAAPIVGLAGKCLDDAGDGVGDGNVVQLYTCDGTDAQQWSWSSGALVGPGGKCLDVTGASSANGTPVELWECNGGTNQQWASVDGQLVGLAGKCLDVRAFDTSDGAVVELWDCNGGANQQWAVGGGSGAPVDAGSPPDGGSPGQGGGAHVPTGISGKFTAILDATFGTARADATVTGRSDLDALAYYWFEYGAADTDPPYYAQSGAPNDCRGPAGDGTDGLYGNFYSRFVHCDPGSPWDRHVMGGDRLTLKASCGLLDGNAGNCSDGNIGGGMLRFTQSFRPTATNPIIVEMSGIMPKGMYSWPAFWLNPGVQAARNPDGSPGAVIQATWPPEIDIFDQFGFNGVQPGHYLILGTPTGGNDANYASGLCASQGVSICDLPLTPGGATLPTTSVATFNDWYATTDADLTADFHTYGARIYPDHIDALLDGVVYRSRGYTWPDSSPPMTLILSNQTAAKFNDLSGLVDQGGVPDGWDWQVSYVRVWQQD